jgi:hypothetical protein
LTRTSQILVVVGVLLIAAAAIVRFVVVPSVATLPEDFSSSQDYEGTYSGLNQAALAGAGGDLLVDGVPVTATRSYEAVEVEDGTAVVEQTVERTLAGQESPATTLRYAVDRDTFESAAPPEGAEDVVPSEGLIFSLPLDVDREGDYTLWDQATGAAYPLSYEGESTVADREVYEFRSVAEGELANPEALGLPTSIPKAQLTALAPALEGSLPPEVLAQLPAVLAQLPDVLEISYVSETTSTIFADQAIGATVSSGSTQEITAQLNLGTTIAVPFSTIELSATSDSEQDRADYAADNASDLALVGTILPLVLGALGVLLLLVALVVALIAGRRSREDAA